MTIEGHDVVLTLRIKSAARPEFLVAYQLPGLSVSEGRRRVSLETRDYDQALRRFESICSGQSLKDDLLSALAVARSRSGTTATIDSDPRVGSVLKYYVETYLPAKNAARKSIIKADQIGADFLDYCRRRNVGRCSQLGSRFLQEWQVHLGSGDRSPKTIHNYTGTIRAAFNASVTAGLIAKSPIDAWLMPKFARAEIHPLTTEQVKRLLRIFEEHGPEHLPWVTWIALTGNRPSDVCTLKVRQVDTALRVVERVQVKVKRLEKYSIAPPAAELVARIVREKMLESESLVFTGIRGAPLTVNKMLHYFKRTIARAGGFERSVNLKDLRHTFAYNLANGQPPIPLPVLQVLMGHSRIETTMRYVAAGNALEYLNSFASKLLNEPSTRGTSGTSRDKKA